MWLTVGVIVVVALLVTIAIFGDSPLFRGTLVHRSKTYIFHTWHSLSHGFHQVNNQYFNGRLEKYLGWLVPSFYIVVVTFCIFQIYLPNTAICQQLLPQFFHWSIHYTDLCLHIPSHVLRPRYNYHPVGFQGQKVPQQPTHLFRWSNLFHLFARKTSQIKALLCVWSLHHAI